MDCLCVSFNSGKLSHLFIYLLAKEEFVLVNGKRTTKGKDIRLFESMLNDQQVKRLIYQL